ncbi:hydroxyacid dehydrogenase, partial [Candidatus Acetothermia bacterium]
MPRVLVSSRSFANIVPVGEELLSKAGFEIRRIGPEERPLNEERMKSIVDRERPDVIISGAEPIAAEALASSGNLRLIMKHGVGVDNIDLDAATGLGIAVANAPGTNTDAVADFTIAVILSLLRQVVPAAESTRAGEWNRYLGHELGRQTVGVVGTGRIGQAVIRRLAGFGSPILAYDVYQDTSLVKDFG